MLDSEYIAGLVMNVSIALLYLLRTSLNESTTSGFSRSNIKSKKTYYRIKVNISSGLIIA